ncbi:beta-N-acetylhexosaminidase [Halioxenophilus aromaticivorans]|uniref:Beta-hexosaminidase n=1 Tax=Halioxenophilus aromaticivorans TaxID=1306992 RepID=A0AAV3TYZ3_9ALTE
MSQQTPVISGPAIVDFAGTELTAEDRRVLLHPATAGVILFSRNIVDANQVRQLCAQLRSLRSDLLICMDQEGGRVQRLKQGVARIPPMAKLGLLYRSDPAVAISTVKEVAWLLARQINALGVDLSFAPVLDLDSSHCAAIGDRSFGNSGSMVAQLGAAFCDGFKEAGMAAVGKHFPGHGKVAADSHYELPIDSRPFDVIASDDLVPFTHLCRSHLQAVMPAHIVFPEVHDNAVGFSSVWLQDILRQQLGFAGLIFSDDLSMAAAQSGGSYYERAQSALSAGCDLLLVCNNREGAVEVLDKLATTQMSQVAYQAKLAMINKSSATLSEQESARLQSALALVEQVAQIDDCAPKAPQ